jgi:LacI family transcriptional regulator
MVRHLVERGHRRIAFITGPDDNFDARERLRGYRDALAELLPGEAEWVLPGDFSEAAGHDAGVLLAKGPQLPDAVFAANDMMALGCLFAFNQAGVSVPGQVALVGVDDIPLARYVHPTLTTMRVNISELGERALRALLDPSSEAAAANEPIVPKLIERGSSGGVAGQRERGDSS